MAAEGTWTKFTPLIQIVGRKPTAEQIKAGNVTSWTGKINSAVGERPIFLDILRPVANYPVLTGGGREVPLIEILYQSARKRKLQFVPVYRVGESIPAVVAAVAGAAEEDRRGMALRWAVRKVAPPGGMNVTNYLENLLIKLRTEVNSTDLLIDLGYIDQDAEVQPDDIGSILTRSLQVGAWRNIVLIGTSVPSTLGCIKEGTVGEIERRECTTWTEASRSEVGSRLAFGDYAIQSPIPPPEDIGGGGIGRANIRYTTSKSTTVARGRGPWNQEGLEQYVGLSEKIKSLEEYSGANYSWGDEIIDGCARGEIEPGDQRMWRGAGTSHHLRFVTDQLALSKPG
jgi:hypothetical protein